MSELPEIGAVLGRWTLVKRLGEGAMGPVFEAVSTGGTQGALHLVRPDLVALPDATEQLKRDARAFQKVEHPNVPRLLDVDEGSGKVFLVFELVQGRTLQYRLDKKEMLTPDESRDLAADLLTGLATLHERGILHGDVTPSRLLSGPEGYWKLTGFSLIPRDKTPDAPGVIRGTPLYMAPERAQGQPDSIVSDLYSAGATIYAALSGEPPFMRPSVEAILAAHVNDAPPELASRCPGAEKELVLLVLALLGKMPSRRPPDARTALAALGQRTKPRAKTQLAVKTPEIPSDAPAVPFDPAAQTMAGAPPEPPPPPGTKTTKRKAHEYVEAIRQGDQLGKGSVPWARAIVPILLAGGLAALAIRQSGGGAPTGPALVIAGGAVAFALLGVMAVLAGVVPRGVSNHATARTLYERIPLKMTVWWNRKSDPIRAALALGQLGELGAGELLLDAGEPALAAEEFLRAQIPLAAAIVFERLGDAERAIDTYIFAGKLEDAARVAAERGKLVEAGQAFEEAGHFERAIDAYAKAGVPLRLAVIYEGQGKHAEAAKHYELANELGKAADLYAKAQLPGEAARIHHRTGNLASVAQVWESSGDVVNAARWRAEAELAAGRQANAAREFEKAGMHGRAADIFLAQSMIQDALRCAEKDGEPSRRALLHARSGDFKRAAALYEETGQHAEAARCWNELGEPVREAEALEQAGDALGAAEAWLAAKKDMDARRVLANVPTSVSERRRARARLGELEQIAGRPREAARAFAEALEGESPDPTNVATIISCADALAACGDMNGAIEKLAPIAGLSFVPPTVKMRIVELESQRRAAASPVAQAPALPISGEELVGRELDRYRPLAFAGEGDLAWAYEAEHTLLKRSADLRVLKPTADGAGANRFFAEARSLALARHPNLPDVADSGRTRDGLSYVALEVLIDPSLRQLLRQARGGLPVPRVATIGGGILAAIAAAHEAQVVHGDVRPENVLVSANDEVKVTNFAFARMTPAGAGPPSRLYVAPEQNPGPAADQFSAGVILYEMLAGFGPASPVRPLGDVAQRVPKPLALAVMRAIEPDPRKRHPSVKELARVLAGFASAVGVS